MATFNYESKIISGISPESVNADLSMWINSRQGEIEVVSSNMIVYKDAANGDQRVFAIYTLFILFPVN